MTYFIDLDGTILYYHKNKFTAGAKNLLKILERRGHQIVLITQRGPQDAQQEWSPDNTRRFFQDMGFGHLPLVFGVQPGRVVIDDTAGAYIYHKQDKHWDEDAIGEALSPKGMR